MIIMLSQKNNWSKIDFFKSELLNSPQAGPARLEDGKEVCYIFLID